MSIINAFAAMKAPRYSTPAPRTLSIESDPDLMELFIRDMDGQPDVWKPTPYWVSQCRRIQRELDRFGLDEFRSNASLMAGVDLGPKQGGIARQPVFRSKMGQWLADRIPPCGRYSDYIDALISRCNAANASLVGRELSLLYYLLNQGKYAGPILSRVEDSGIGDPRLYEFDGKRYSSNLLHHISLLGLLFQLAGSDDLARFVEIGGGYGALPEMILKYRAGSFAYFVEIDIPPLVYVTTQYLKATFPGKVVDYRRVRTATWITPADIDGMILVIPPWMIPRLSLEFDVLWNSISFQEMEREVVLNYLDYFSKTTKRMFINTRTQGHKAGLGGQRHPIAFEWLRDQIKERGFEEREHRDDCIERAALRSLLPHHSAALFVGKGDRENTAP